MIPQNDNEREILQRLQTLEKIIFRGKTYEDNYGRQPKQEENPKEDNQ